MNDWQSVPLRSLIRPVSEKNQPNMQMLSVLREKGVIVRSHDKTVNHNTIPEDLSGYKVVRAGQFVINKMKAWQGSCGVSLFDGIVSPAYFVFDLQGANPRFFNYAIRSKHFINEFGRISSGIRVGQWDLSIDALKYLRFLLPSRTEQDQIVCYLDWKVSQVNRLINTKKNQIGLLHEQKRGIINRMVTRGGKSWTETRLINLVERVQAGSWGDNENVLDSNIVCVRVADFDFFRLRVRNAKYTIRSYQQATIEKLLLRKNDILIEKSGGGNKQTVGRAVLFDKDIPALCANFIEFARPKDTVCSAFLVYLLASMYYRELQKFHFNQTTGIQNLDVKSYLRESAQIPLLCEQETIVTELDAQCTKFDKLTDKINTDIALLHEYRTRLISDVVTGKLDVREVAVPEFEAVEEASTDETEDDVEQETDDADSTEVL
ncbi:MAG: restriction endonuclease subunit S [Eubacteriales bacterium]